MKVVRLSAAQRREPLRNAFSKEHGVLGQGVRKPCGRSGMVLLLTSWVTLKQIDEWPPLLWTSVSPPVK